MGHKPMAHFKAGGVMDTKTLPCTDCGKPLEVSSRVSSVTCGSCVDAWYSDLVDVATLCVGDKVLMGSGCYGSQGTVIRVGPLGVDVQTDGGGEHEKHKELEGRSNCGYAEWGVLS